MRRRAHAGIAMVLLFHIALVLVSLAQRQPDASKEPRSSGGELIIKGPDGGKLGYCPLQETEVRASISGFISRTRVKQLYRNPLDQKIEAVYVFPLPQDSAVDEMTMIVGQRRIVGVIKPKEQAKKTYERAKKAGQVASLLEQQRPNIFTQSVANIEPGAEVSIEISYVETLKFEDGVFEWVFPMVVGPRYIPGDPTQRRASGTGIASDTDRVPDASQISPPIAPEGMRAGHDVSVTVEIDGGMPIHDVQSKLHSVSIDQATPERATVTLDEKERIPNQDFILRYRTATDQIGDAFFVHEDTRGRFFTLILQPPMRVPQNMARPKEMIFVIDRSGSQSGFPILKAKETMRLCIQGMNPADTFNLLSFSNETELLFARPVPNTAAYRRRALEYLDGMEANGGTELLKAVTAALIPPPDPRRIRIVCFMTDGYVGNDFEIIDTVKKYSGQARLFSFGIGNSVNRYLLDGMAHAGNGEVEYVTLHTQGSSAALRFHERIQSPVLTDVRIDWQRLPVSEVYPKQIPDLFSTKPVLLHGRLNDNRIGTITLHGNTANGRFQRRVAVTAPDALVSRDSIASLWARAKVKDLMMQDLPGLQSGNIADRIKEQITQVGVEYRLMTQFTSFVAVQENIVTRPGPLATVPVPVDLPKGVSREAIFGATVASPIVQARAGDPLIRVEAPADAAHVIAILPGNEVKRLVYNRDTRRWEARFDIPTYAAEGDYPVTVIVVLKDGLRHKLALHYRVDNTRPNAAAKLRADSGLLRLQIDTSDDASRVSALLPWGEKLALIPSPDAPNRFTGTAQIPPSAQNRILSVTYIVTDRAHNRTVLTVDEEQ